MATKTHTANRDARVTSSPYQYDGGSGTCPHLDVGTYVYLGNTYIYDSWLAFTGESWSGIPSASAITKAVLRVYAGTQAHVARVAGTMRVRRTATLGQIFTEGSSYDLSSSNAVRGDNAPVTTSTNQATATIGDSNGWKEVVITDIIKAYYGLSNYALQLHGTSGVYEFNSREAGSNTAHVVITYDPNSVPTAPDLVSPAGAYVDDTTPDLTFRHHDPDGDAAVSYQVQVDEPAATPDYLFAVPVWDSGTLTSAPPADNATKSVTVGSVLLRGIRYHWRARTADAGGNGPWSAAAWFQVGYLPTATVTTPASGHTGELYYAAGSNTTPKLRLRWAFADADGHQQSHYRYRIYSDVAGTVGPLLYDSDWVASGAQSADTAYAVANGVYYHCSVQVRCTSGLESAESTKNRTRARWARASYYHNTGTTPVLWGTPIVSATIQADEALTVEYSATSSASEPGTWYATLGEAPLLQYVWHRATFMGWGSATPTTPDLHSVELVWSATSLTPDNWTLSGGAAIDTGTQFYGSQALRLTQTGAADVTAYQALSAVQAHTDYTLQARIKTQGNPAATIRITSADGATVLAQSSEITTTADWSVANVSWNSGGTTSVRVYAFSRDTGSNSGTAWFDAFMLAASTITQPWSPGFVGDAVVIDSGGLQVDAQAGGVFRLRGSTAGSRDVVDLGQKGLRFGGLTTGPHIYSDTAGRLVLDHNDETAAGVLRLNGNSTPTLELGVGGTYDVNLYRSAANVLKTDDSLSVGTGGFLRVGHTAFPGSPSADDLFYRKDLGMLFRYDGTRWVCACLHMLTGGTQRADFPLTASANASFWQAIDLQGCSDIWLETSSVAFFVNSGGSALSGSHKWVVDVQKLQDASATETSIATHNIDSGSSAVHRTLTATIDALLNSGTTHTGLHHDITKTGTPGDLYVTPTTTYRFVAT